MLDHVKELPTEGMSISPCSEMKLKKNTHTHKTSNIAEQIQASPNLSLRKRVKFEIRLTPTPFPNLANQIVHP